MPAPMITGFPGCGPNSLESVLKRRLNSHTLFTASAQSTKTVSSGACGGILMAIDFTGPLLTIWP